MLILSKVTVDNVGVPFLTHSVESFAYIFVADCVRLFAFFLWRSPKKMRTVHFYSTI